jgi:hypothetical protein
MTTSKKWTSLLACAVLCAMPVKSYANEVDEGSPDAQPFAQTTAGTSWDAQEPVTPPPAIQKAPNTNGASAAGDCGTCESCCMPGFSWIVSVEATFFWPQFNRNFLENTLTNDLGTTTVFSNGQNGSANGNLLAAPRVTWGLQGECWGLVGRFWYGSVWA